jgi:uncharacterized protein
MIRAALQCLAVTLVLSACATAAQPPSASTSAVPAQLKGFPRDRLVIQRATGRDVFQIWIADTPDRHLQGLMWLKQLAPDQGMLFLLESPRPFSLWMKNTYVPLDMLFLDENGRISGITRRTTPLSTDIIPSPGNVSAVLEILAGESDRRGIEVGDRVLFPGLGGQQ